MSKSMPFTVSKGGSWVAGALELMLLAPVTRATYQRSYAWSFTVEYRL